MADLLLRLEIEEFLYAEAELLDNRRYEEWLDLFTEDKLTLRQRVAKLGTGFAWAEEPPSRTRHVVSNVRIRAGASPDELTAVCNFITYRTRLSTDEDVWIGERHDTLRKVDGRWMIAARKIYLDQAVLKSKNLSSFL
jgi:3-phenylpropionate/cinnamic acid dioxygenase small subunit